MVRTLLRSVLWPPCIPYREGIFFNHKATTRYPIAMTWCQISVGQDGTANKKEVAFAVVFAVVPFFSFFFPFSFYCYNTPFVQPLIDLPSDTVRTAPLTTSNSYIHTPSKIERQIKARCFASTASGPPWGVPPRCQEPSTALTSSTTHQSGSPRVLGSWPRHNISPV